MKIIITLPNIKRNTLNPITALLAMLAIYAMVIPVFILDISLWIYQTVHFSIIGIPKIKRSEYVGIDRWDLSKLTFWQKLNCAYCDYANGVIDFAKAVARQTELYNCAIKYSHAKKNTEIREQYMDRKDFE